MRLFSWIATLAAATVLCGAGLASAANYTAKLTPVPESDEPDASGVAKVSGANRVYVWGGYYYEGNLTVTFRGLTPGATYSTPAGGFSHGTSMATGQLPSCASTSRPTAFR